MLSTFILLVLVDISLIYSNTESFELESVLKLTSSIVLSSFIWAQLGIVLPIVNAKYKSNSCDILVL